MSASVDDYARWLGSLSPEQIDEGNRAERRRVDAEFAHFKQSHSKGKCYICHRSYAAFDEDNPCLHWLLRPKGFKKRKHVPSVFGKWGYHRMSAYLRWLANTEKAFGNINDLPEEHRPDALFAASIRFERFEWSFLCLPSDFAGHEGTAAGASPHYHFQMTDSGQPFIVYNDFHLPLHDDDLMKLELKRRYPGLVTEQFTYGAGMKTLLDAPDQDALLAHARPTRDPAKATTHIQTIITAAPGTTISADEIAALENEASSMGVLKASLAKNLGHTVTVVVEPAEGVPAAAERSGRRRTR
jgi:hypothetical protein